MITGGEWQVDWVTSVIEDLDRRGVARIDATPEAEQGWAAEMEEMAAKTLYRYADSWYVGANIPGKPRNFMIYIGGFNAYTARCTGQVRQDYDGFVLTRDEQHPAVSTTYQ